MTTDTAPATVKDAAAAIRRDLRAAFPATTFSVHMGTGTASTWIDVKWTDGPNDDMVRNVTDRYEKFGSPVEGICRERHVSMAVLLQAQDLVRAVLPGFGLYDEQGRYLVTARPDRVEVFYLGGWRFGDGSAVAALQQVADLLILNPRKGPAPEMTTSSDYPFITTVHRPGLPDVHLGFAFQHQAELACWSLTEDLIGTAHVEGTTVTWSPTPDGVCPQSPVLADVAAVASLIEQEPDDVSPERRFPDLFSRLKAQEGYETASRIWREACRSLDDDGEV